VQAEKEVAARNVDFIVSTGTRLQTEDQVKKLISNSPDPGVVLARVTPTEAAREPGIGDVLPVETAIKAAIANRPEMRQLEYDLLNKDIEIKYAKNQMLPTLDLTGSFVQNGVGGTETLRNGFGPGAPIVAVNEGGVLNSLGQVLSFGYPGFSLGINIEVPLGRRSNQADYSRAYTEKRIAEERRASTAQAIALEVRNAITAVDTNKARIAAAKKTRELAERTLEAEQKKFEFGASTIRFVLEEQRNLIQAQTNEIAALVNYAKVLVDYRRAIGDTLKTHNIDIDQTLTATGPSKTGTAPPKR
jgi:outer membrane protein TolC